MRALLTVLAVIMIAALLCATYMLLGDLLDPFKSKWPGLIVWTMFFIPTIILVHFAWFRGGPGDGSKQ